MSEEKSKKDEIQKDETVKTEANNNSITTKARYWVGVGWLDNMVENWQDKISEVLQHPFCYCVHDKDVDSQGNPRPRHVHIMIAGNAPTTYKNALSIFKGLEAKGKQAFNTCYKVNNVRHMYEYLIHATEDSKKKKKHLYDVSERVCGNNFDIGMFEQISQADKDRMLDELEDIIFEKGFLTYGSFFLYVKYHMSSEHRKIMRSYSSHLERLVRSNHIEREEHVRRSVDD